MNTALRVLSSSALVLALASGAVAQDSNAVPGWLDYEGGSGDWQESKQTLQDFGEEFETSWDLYEALESAADGGEELTWEQMDEAEYDWSGIYTRTKGGLSFDPDVSANETTAQLTEEGAAARQAKIDAIAAANGEYDPISDCRPPGFPRWLSEPFLHEYIVTPEQTWLINEMVNDVRRVYTDGREHTDPADAYATWNGDTIGFWTDGMLVTHTTYLKEGQYQRGTQPNYSDQVEIVERWHKVDDVTLESDVWVFDPVNLAEPWYTRQSWTELANDDHYLRIKYWDCRENQNNDITQTEDGSSQFTNFDFVENDAEVSDDPEITAAE